MAIAENSAIEFFGTQDSLANSTSAVAAGAFSDGTNDLSAWTNDDDAVYASVTLDHTWTSTAPDAGTVVNLYAQLVAVDPGSPTGNTTAPSATYPHHYLGSFPTALVTTRQWSTMDISLPGTKTSQIYNFYIENMDGTDSIAAGWDLLITPKAIGPHPA